MTGKRILPVVALTTLALVSASMAPAAGSSAVVYQDRVNGYLAKFTVTDGHFITGSVVVVVRSKQAPKWRGRAVAEIKVKSPVHRDGSFAYTSRPGDWLHTTIVGRVGPKSMTARAKITYTRNGTWTQYGQQRFTLKAR